MFKLEEILIPIDFSERAEKAAAEVVEIAQRTPCKLFFYHSFKRPHAGAGSTATENAALLKVKEDKLKHKFQEMVLRIPGLKKTDHEFIMEPGISIQNIKRILKKKKVDLIVMATHGTPGWDILTGSRTTALIRELRGPILVLPDHARLNSIKKIAVGVDFSSSCEAKDLEPAVVVAEIFGAVLKVVDVREANLPKTKRHLFGEQEIRDLVKDRVKLEFESVFARDVEDGLKDYLKELDIDLLALIPLHRNFIVDMFHDSLTEKMAGTLKRPILTLAQSYEARQL